VISGVVVVVVAVVVVLVDTVLDTVAVTRRVRRDVLRAATTTMTIRTRRSAAPTIARHPGRFLRGAARDDSGRYHLPSDATHHPGP
jgi:hypothetical protein